MRDKIKIAHIQLLPLVTGVQRVSLDELERLDVEQFETYIVCKEPGPLNSLASESFVKSLYCGNLVRNISIYNDLVSLFKLYKVFKNEKFDIVHTHSSKTGVIGRIAAKLAGVPLIFHTVHGFAFPTARSRFEKFFFRMLEAVGVKFSDTIVCLHETDAQIALNDLGAFQSQIRILPNGVDVHKFTPASMSEKSFSRSKFGIDEDTYLIGMVGRLWKQKNPKALIDAAFNVLSEHENVQFVFAGDGELRKELEEAVSTKGFSHKIHFLGWQNDIPSILSMLDIFVLPSLWEGMPLAILEAQASGLPCVVSNIQGNNHLIEHNYDGLLFNLDEPRMLSQYISLLLERPDLIELFGERGRKKVIKNHNIDARVDVMSSLYIGQTID